MQPDAVEHADSLRPLSPPDPWHVRDAQALADFVPPSFMGVPTTLGTSTDELVTASWQVEGRTVELRMEALTDVAATRARFELLGTDAVGRMDGVEIRGMRVQGNPAQATMELSGARTSTLDVVAANTWLVSLSITPGSGSDELVQAAEGLDIGSMTLFAIQQHKARQQSP